MGAGDTAYMGYSSYLGLAGETAYGTHITATTYFEFTSESLKRTIEPKMLESINTTRNYRTRILMNESVEGSIEAPLNLAADGIVWLIKQAMGGTCTSAQVAATTAYAHTIYEGDMESNKSSASANDLKGISITVRRGSDNTFKWQYDGCRVNSLSIKGDVGSEVMLTAELVGKTGSLSTDTNTAAFTNVIPVNFTGITIQIGDTSTTLSTTSYTGFEFILGNNLNSDDKSRELGSRTVKVLPAGMRDIGLKLTQRFDTTSSYTDYVNNTPKVFKILLDVGTTIGAAGSSTYSMHILIPRAYYGPNQPEIGDAGVITHELELQALQDTTSSYGIQMQINNATTGYDI